MSPGGGGALLYGLQKFRPLCRIFDLGEFLRQVQIIPADDGVFDEPFARFGHFLILLFGLQKLPWAADRHRPREAMHVLDPVEHLLDGHAQRRFIDVPQDEKTLRDLPKGLQCLIQGVLLRIGVQAPEDIGGGGFLPSAMWALVSTYCWYSAASSLSST